MTGPTVAPATPETKSSSRSRAAYRPDIDGLRALAIIPVLLFHGGFSAFRGGFVGGLDGVRATLPLVVLQAPRKALHRDQRQRISGKDDRARLGCLSRTRHR